MAGNLLPNDMREIKFRAWDKKKRRMHQVTTLFLDNNGHQPGAGFSDLIYWNSLKDHALMQFTDLKDKNGIEIYEGDVVKMDANTDEEADCLVEWMDGGFVLIGVGYNAQPIGAQIRSYGGDGLFGEVIGNIYENPELLK